MTVRYEKGRRYSRYVLVTEYPQTNPNGLHSVVQGDGWLFSDEVGIEDTVSHL